MLASLKRQQELENSPSPSPRRQDDNDGSENPVAQIKATNKARSEANVTTPYLETSE